MAAHVESFYLDANLESDATSFPQIQNDTEAQFTADHPLDGEAITRIIESQQHLEKKKPVESDYCVAASDANPNALTMSSSVLANHKYFAPPPRIDSSHYAFHAEATASHHQYAPASPNIYTNDYLTSEPSDYVYM